MNDVLCVFGYVVVTALLPAVTFLQLNLSDKLNYAFNTKFRQSGLRILKEYPYDLENNSKRFYIFSTESTIFDAKTFESI